jgi:hypothetical protein
MRWVVTLAGLLVLAWSSAAHAAEPTYGWSGSMTVVRTHSGPESGGVAQFTGPISPSAWGDVAWFQPTMVAWSDWHQADGSWCRSTQELRPGDVGDEAVPIFVEWGRVGPDGVPLVPRVVPPAGRAWSFPRHSEQCLAFDGGELQRIPDSRDGSYSLEDAFLCTGDLFPYRAPGTLPFAASDWLPPPLPAKQVLGDGSIRFEGAVRMACDPFAGESASELVVSVALVGTPVPDPSAEPVITVDHELQVEVRGTQYGSVAGGGGVLACGMGGLACTARVPGGSPVRMAALPGAAGTFLFWEGCDVASGQSCIVTLGGPRTVRAWFGYDFMGQSEPPPDGLFDLDRKAEIAGNGAAAARNGAVGCALSAGLIGTGGSSGVLVAGTAGAASRWQALVEKAFEETVGNCLTGFAGTVFNGVLLKVDPPDPAWRQVALAARFPRARVRACRQRGCAALTRATRALAAAEARVAELSEALAVAANRYGNAVNADDRGTQALHQASMRATSGLLAGAYAGRNRAASSLARAIRATGVRSVTVPKRVVARAYRARSAGRAVPRAAVRRLLRKHLITHAREIPALLQSVTPRRPATIDVLAALERPLPTEQMRAAAAVLTIGDVGRLLHAVAPDTGARAPYDAHLNLALRCDGGAAQALRRLAAAVSRPGGLRGEARRLVAAAAREVATHDLGRDEVCRPRPSGPGSG